MILGKIFFLYIFIQKVKVTPLNQFRELQILWFFPARSSDTGTAGTGIEILGSFSAHPLLHGKVERQELKMKEGVKQLKSLSYKNQTIFLGGYLKC